MGADQQQEVRPDSSVDPSMRISTRYGAPTPDDLDELLRRARLEEAGVLLGSPEGHRGV